MKNSKIFKILLVGMILLTSIQTYAFTDCSDEDLITAMSMDEDVKATIELSAKVSMIYGIAGNEVNNLPNDAKDKLNKAKDKINNLKTKIQDKYPLYNNKTTEEKVDIITQVAQRNGFTNFIKKVLRCTVDDFIVFAACVEVTARWRNVTFIACVTGNALGDVALVIATDGANAPAVQSELETGTFICARMLYGAIGESCTITLVTAIAAELVGVLNC